MNFGIKAGDTNVTIYVRLRDLTTGLAKTGLAFGSAGVSCGFVLPLAARVAITLVTQTVTGAHTDGGFVEVDATNSKGLYRLDLTDAAVASGAYSIVNIEFDDVIEEAVEIELDTPSHIGVEDVPTVSEFNARTIASADYFDPAADAVANVTLVATTTTNTDMLTTAAVNAEVDTALADYDGPTNAEMVARTIAAADYFDPAADAVANVTLVATTTTNTDMLTAAAVNAEVDTALSDYDGPTKAEMDTAHGLLATEAKQDIIDTNVDSVLVDTGTTLPATLATIDGIVDAILVDTDTTIPALIAALNDLSAANVNAEVLDVMNVDTLIDGKTFKEAVRFVAAVIAGKLSGAGTGTETSKGLDGSTTRAIFTVDASGNKTAVTYS